MPLIPLHVSALFIALVFGIAFIILIAVYVASKRAGLQFNLRRNYFFMALFLLLAWLIFTLVITTGGMVNKMGNNYLVISMVMLPPFALIAWLMTSKKFMQLIQSIDNFWFIYLQSYRLLREFLLLLLFRYNVIPAEMTFEGKNFDVLIGITAPFVAFYCFKKKPRYREIALVWNFIGLLLITIALVAILFPKLTVGGTVNPFLSSFPFIWLPAFLAPFGIFLHLISIRKLREEMKKPT